MGHDDSQHILSIYYLNAMHHSNCTFFSNPSRYYYCLEIRNMKYRGTILLDPNYTTNKWELRLCGFSAHAAAAAPAKSLQSCPTVCDPVDGSPPGSAVPGILQARTLEWVAISFSNAWKWKVKVKLLSCVRLFATPWTAACQAPPSMGFSRQEYWSGVPLPSPAHAVNCLQRPVEVVSLKVI